MSRKSVVSRNSKETKISLSFNIDGSGDCVISTGIGFFDHMLAGLSRHGLFDIILNAEGDLHVDCHHTVEDVGIVLGKAIREALGDRVGIRRFADVTVAMDDALVLCAIDISGRPFLNFDCAFSSDKIGSFDTETIQEFFRAVCTHAGLNAHFIKFAGFNNHHVAEAAFKAFGKALDLASLVDHRIDGVLSTKGLLED